MKANLAIVLMATSAILVMVLAITPAVASSKEGSFIEEPTERSIEIQKHQIASELSAEMPDWHLENETIMGDYYVALYTTTEVETSREKEAPGGSFLLRFHFVDVYRVVVCKLGSNQTMFFKEYGKG